uniref:hypothetical protein n=1 Tax=Halorussus salinisoli TaxID=2558242 RepID=UPI001484F9EF|nr:hypothetical protein [Halorussus salinisoli]
MVCGDSKESSSLIEFDVTPSISTGRQFAFDENVIPSPRWTDFGVGVEIVDDICGPVSRGSSIGVTRIIKVDTNEWVFITEDKP